MDECGWKKERYDEIYDKLKPFLNLTGYTDGQLVWIPVAGIDGSNLNAKVDKAICSWYDGPHFMDVID